MDNLYYSLSFERLSTYKTYANDTREDILKLYTYNIRLSEAIYPLLSLIEVSLRNKIYNSISSNALIDKKTLQEKTFEELLNGYELDNYLKAIKKLKDDGKPATTGQIIAELSFGFWKSICQNKYKPLIWNKKNVFDDVFENFDIKTSDRLNYVKTNIITAHKLRNRVFHHEPIFNHPHGIKNVHEKLKTLLYWLSRDLYKQYIAISTFDYIYESGKNLKCLK